MGGHLHLATLSLLAGWCAALHPLAAPRAPQGAARAAAPAMQFFNPKKDGAKPGGPKRAGRRGGDFYDDEVDTVTQEPWQPKFVENGEVDLANVGGEYYIFFIPVLLLFIAYSTGLFSFGYTNGNF